MISEYIIYFVLFSICGWVFECVYCSVKEGHFQNRGFLYGPVCPIYGFGATAVMIFVDCAGVQEMRQIPVWLVFLVCMAGSAVLEYLTSYVLERFFHAVWWDYSNMPLNLNGRICLPASLLFGFMGVVLGKYLFPWLAGVRPSLIIWTNALVTELIGLALAFVMGMDTSLTISSLTNLVRRLDEFENAFNARAEAGYTFLHNTPETVRDAAELKREELAMRMQEYVAHFSRRQNYHFRSIQQFRGYYKRPADLLRSRVQQLHVSLVEKAGEAMGLGKERGLTSSAKAGENVESQNTPEPQPVKAADADNEKKEAVNDSHEQGIS